MTKTRLYGFLGMLAALVALGSIGAPWLSAQPSDTPPSSPPPPPPQRADGEPGQNGTGEGRRARPTLTREELRARFRQFLDQRAGQLRREQEEIERAVRMFDEGKTVEEIRAEFPDRPRGSGQRRGGGGGGGWGGDWLQRWEQGEGMPGDPPFDRGSDRGPDRGPRSGDSDGPRQGPGAERDPTQPITSEERETIRDFIRSTAPQMLAGLDELEKRDEAMAEKKYRDMLRKTRLLLELRKRDKAMYDLRLADIKSGREAIEAARLIAQMDVNGIAADAPDRAAQTQTLHAAVNAQFVTRTAIKRHELTRSRDRAANDEKELASRESRREQIVTDSMSKLVDYERRRLDGKGDHDGPPRMEGDPAGPRPDDPGGPGGPGRRGPPRRDGEPRAGQND